MGQIDVTDVGTTQDIFNICVPPVRRLPMSQDLSEYIVVEGLSLRYMNGSNRCDRCGHDTRHFQYLCTACEKTANVSGPACQSEACLQTHHSNHLAKWNELIYWLFYV